MRPAPPPQPPAPMGAAKNKRGRACAPGRRTDRTQRSLVSANWSGMGGHAPHGQHNASDPVLLPAQGRQRDGMRQSDLPPYRPRPGRTTGGYGARPPPPARPPACERHGPTPRRAAPTGRAGRRDRAGPPHPHARPHNRWIADPDSPPSGRAVGGGGAHDPRRPTQREKALPPGTPCRHPHNPKPSRGEPGPDRPPPSTPDGARDRGRTSGGARTTWNGPTSAQCRDHARCARHTTQGGGERTPRERERTHTKGTRGDYQKGNRTERAERTDRVEWRTSERG